MYVKDSPLSRRTCTPVTHNSPKTPRTVTDTTSPPASVMLTRACLPCRRCLPRCSTSPPSPATVSARCCHLRTRNPPLPANAASAPTMSFLPMSPGASGQSVITPPFPVKHARSALSRHPSFLPFLLFRPLSSCSAVPVALSHLPRPHSAVPAAFRPSLPGWPASAAWPR